MLINEAEIIGMKEGGQETHNDVDQERHVQDHVDHKVVRKVVVLLEGQGIWCHQAVKQKKPIKSEV